MAGITDWLALLWLWEEANDKEWNQKCREIKENNKTKK